MEQFAIRFAEISPSQMSASMLADLIKKYEAAVLSEYKKTKDKTSTESQPIVALTSIEDNCILLNFKVPDVLIESARFVLSLPQDGYSRLSVATKQSKAFIQTVRQVSQFYDTPTEFIHITSDNRRQLISKVSITDTPEPSKNTYSSITSLYGKVSMVGGKKPKVRLSLENGASISCDLKDEETIFQAAALLHKDVVVTGTALIVQTDKEAYIQSFEIDSIQEFKALKPSSLIQKLAPLVKKQIDRIEDINGYFAKLREDN